jgi:hypothetical protein
MMHASAMELSTNSRSDEIASQAANHSEYASTESSACLLLRPEYSIIFTNSQEIHYQLLE